ncbi:hypothetical protein ALC62_14351 [Cyphomyrmex costatus]|uniref:Reverse transcriptase domain-containing protein n=1 Tax=Cyphomyrmex costatus TaxID=456900 RepID=A0A151I8L8_9HYME|nr:hypothetical protein ALC62_14351 [Cyphomyrmex costatus]
MEGLLAAVEAEAASVGLRFNSAKCATLHIGAGNGGRVLPTRFCIQGGDINPLAEGESYAHLGVPTGFSVDQTPYAAVGDIVSIGYIASRALSLRRPLRRYTAEAQRCPAPPLESE